MFVVQPSDTYLIIVNISLNIFGNLFYRIDILFVLSVENK